MLRPSLCAALVWAAFCPERMAAASPAPARRGEVKPVYESGPALPLAEKLCAALHGLPESRRAQCCSGKPQPRFAGECVRILSAALRARSVTVDPGAADKCAAAQGRAFEGCSWVGQWRPPLPSECEGIVRGRLAAGAVCRSSLECPEGEYCLGAGPTDSGRCGPPRGDGQACLVSVDPLAVYTRQDESQKRHPECKGFCGHRRCEPFARANDKCSAARQCGEGLHCDGEKCAPPAFAAVGEKCVGGSCAAGLRCVAGLCAEPRPEGAACTDDYQCLGGCLPSTHVCGMRCDVR